MKRSEMVKDLVKLLKTWENCAMDAMVANDVLDFLEHKGMLPPPKCIVKVEEIGGVYTIKPWDWEPENDKRKSRKRHKPSS